MPPISSGGATNVQVQTQTSQKSETTERLKVSSSENDLNDSPRSSPLSTIDIQDSQSNAGCGNNSFPTITRKVDENEETTSDIDSNPGIPNPLQDILDGEEIDLYDVAIDNLLHSDKPAKNSVHAGNMLGKKYSVYDVMDFLKTHTYPAVCNTKNDKSNFRKQCKPFAMHEGELYHKTHSGKSTDRGRDNATFPGYAKVIFNQTKQKEVIVLTHEGSANSLEATALSAHRGINNGADLIARRVWWSGFSLQYREYVKCCDTCQRYIETFVFNQVNTAVIKVKDPLCSVAPPRENLRQIGVDIIQLPEADGLKYVVVAIDYLSKYTHAKALENKSAVEVGRFLLEWICLFGCPKVVINDQGREFVNAVSDYLYKKTGTRQRVTSAYNPQANGQVSHKTFHPNKTMHDRNVSKLYATFSSQQVERQNAVIKCGLLKVLRQNISEWPSVLDGVLFAHRVQKQRSTGYSPFFLLFGQEPKLPVDVLIENTDEEEPFDDNEEENSEYIATSELESVTDQFIKFKKNTLLKARENIRDAQNTQRKEYDRRNKAGQGRFKVVQRVLRRNLRRDDRKGGWALDRWLGPYIIIKMLKFGKQVKCVLRNVLTGRIYKTTQKQSNLTPYYSNYTHKTHRKKSTKNKSKTKITKKSDGEKKKGSLDNLERNSKGKPVWDTLSEKSSSANESSDEIPSKRRKKDISEERDKVDNIFGKSKEDEIEIQSTDNESNSLDDLFPSPIDASDE
ncbi:hypothetical protein FOCC_FOCC009153, partial [Frankliniella occidentalis]